MQDKFTCEDGYRHFGRNQAAKQVYHILYFHFQIMSKYKKNIKSIIYSASYTFCGDCGKQ